MVNVVCPSQTSTNFAVAHSRRLAVRLLHSRFVRIEQDDFRSSRAHSRSADESVDVVVVVDVTAGDLLLASHPPRSRLLTSACSSTRCGSCGCCLAVRSTSTRVLNVQGLLISLLGLGGLAVRLTFHEVARIVVCVASQLRSTRRLLPLITNTNNVL